MKILNIIAFLLTCISLYAGEATVSWTFATNNVDGTPLSDLSGAKIYYGTSSSNYTIVIDVPGGKGGQSKSFTVTGLVVNVKYYLNGTAYNISGLESDFCNEVVKIATNKNLIIPSFPKGLRELK